MMTVAVPGCDRPAPVLQPGYSGDVLVVHLCTMVVSVRFPREIVPLVSAGTRSGLKMGPEPTASQPWPVELARGWDRDSTYLPPVVCGQQRVLLGLYNSTKHKLRTQFVYAVHHTIDKTHQLWDSTWHNSDRMAVATFRAVEGTAVPRLEDSPPTTLS